MQLFALSCVLYLVEQYVDRVVDNGKDLRVGRDRVAVRVGCV